MKHQVPLTQDHPDGEKVFVFRSAHELESAAAGDRHAVARILAECGHAIAHGFPLPEPLTAFVGGRLQEVAKLLVLQGALPQNAIQQAMVGKLARGTAARRKRITPEQLNGYADAMRLGKRITLDKALESAIRAWDPHGKWTVESLKRYRRPSRPKPTPRKGDAK